MHVIDVSDPETPELVSEQHLIPRYTIGMHVTGETMYIKDETRFQRVFDISDPLDPQQICEVDLRRVRFDEGQYLSSGVFNNEPLFLNYNEYLYSLCRGYFVIFNNENPADLTLEGRYRFHGGIKFAFQYDQYYCFLGALYDYRHGANNVYKTIMVHDFSDPLEPERVFMANDLRNNGGGTRSAWRKDNLIFQLAGDLDDMFVYNMDTPQRPQLLGQWPDGNYGEFFICRDYAYCFDRNLICIYSIEDPLEPELINQVEFVPNVWGVTLDQEIAYLDCSDDGLFCLSVDNPVEPEIVGFYDTPGFIETMLIHDEYLYVADGYELGIYQLTNQPGQDADFTIELREGWNLVSSPFVPENDDIEVIFERLMNREELILAKDYLGRFCLPSQNFNNIPRWDVNQGYLVKMNESDRLWIYGEEVEANRPIPLPEGWSMVSYFPEQEIMAPVAFVNIADQFLFAKDGDGHFYSPEFNFNNIPPLHRGAGYQVKVSEEVELVWNVEGEVASGGEGSMNRSLRGGDRPPRGDWMVVSTGQNMSVLVNGCESGEIAAFSTDGTCVGTGTVDPDGRCGLAVWGDDCSTDEVDGLKEGEVFTLKLWSSNLNEETDLEIKSVLTGYTGFSGFGLVYETNGFSVIEAIDLPSIPDQYFLAQNYPNPFNSTTLLPYGLPETSRLSIRIYDISGRMVKTLVDGNIEAGYHTAIWDASTVSAGVYLVKMETAAFSSVRKVILVR